ncbi:acyl-CoA dehydrogenase [Rhizorhapis sp. SPR117]|uniref:acyl-CoA dehydrogenase n=1 Tax=Rhizorhapis sp. SPR117 TaxID=2912611 RepID=UPI001F1933A7|nr:acyl-CoA dehydrogenase [Rhizorhapis sp. SPR117]
MSIILDESQQQIAAGSTRQLEAQFNPEHLKTLLETRGAFDERFWTTCKEQGWTTIGIPEEYGGIGMGPLELGLIAEACGSVVCGAPFLTASFGAAQAILAFADEDIKQEWLPKLASGEIIGTVAFAEGRDFIPETPTVRFADGRITGKKPAVSGGARADIAVVLASGGQGPILCVASLGTIERPALPTFDNSRNAADLDFNDTPAIVLAAAGDAREAALEVLRRQAVITAFEQVGGAQRCLDMEREYATTRRAFGQVLAAFQSIKHRIAENYILTEMARANAMDAAASFGTIDFPRAVAAARLSSIDAYDTVVRDAMQTQGGMGATWESDLHLHQRRSRTLAIEQGNMMFWEDRLVEELVRQAERGPVEQPVTQSDTMSDVESFRMTARTWLEFQVAEFGREAQRGKSEQEILAMGRRYMTAKHEAGYGGIDWPVEFGGQGLGHLKKLAFDEEEMKYGFPTAFFGISLGQPLPILIRYRSDEWAREKARKALRGEEIWCQLFSEPSGGSDLAGLRTRAVQDEETGDWIINGQKLWTSWAQYSEYGIIVVRTDPNVVKHKGLTYFWLDMRTPGITVKPVKLAVGDCHVNEVFFDDVRIPDSQRMGAIGGGFGVAMETLMIERYQATDPTGFGPPLELLLEQAQNGTLNGKALIEDRRVRERLARACTVQSALTAIHKRALQALSAGLEPGPEGAVHKLVSVRARQKLSEFAVDLQGPAGQLHPDIHVSAKETWQQSWLASPIGRIAGGADEMLLNTIAERILGLPQDHRPDKGVPFNQIPT